ncbi:hypothetical protein ACJIZ3_005949 [Penstemon smallii]|uniref:MADS-box domain-containing protein n=1 Tax=Penstemon smallii TaxID=265156 RepID=A0ABD3S6C0_9LAMI
MPRRKVTLAYMSNKSERKISFNKRKKGLIKKASELCTLCAVDGCAIIYSPFESQPEVWPSPEETASVLSRYNSLPEIEQTRYMTNLESFTKQRLEKSEKRPPPLANREQAQRSQMFYVQMHGWNKKTRRI